MQGLHFSKGKEKVGVEGSGLCPKQKGGTRSSCMDVNLLRFIQRACSTLGKAGTVPEVLPQPL